MPRYLAEWVGLDPGREGLWREDKWLAVLEIISRHEGEAVYSADSPIYAELESAFPDDKWMSEDKGAPRPIFRDYPHPWTRIGTLDLTDHTFQLTELGRSVLTGDVLRVTAFQRALTFHQEDGEFPFRVLARAFLEADVPLSTEDLYFGVMKNYRPGDDLDEALLLGEEEADGLGQTARRRLRHMMLVLEETGAVNKLEPGLWVTGDEEVLRRIAAGLEPDSALDPEPSPEVGTRYRTAPEDIDVGDRAPTIIDPDTAGRGLSAHNATQNRLAQALVDAGLRPVSPQGPLDPPFDVGWEAEGQLFVAEVKSLSDSNEAQQIRLGLGQVLDYRHQFRRRGIEALAVLALERRPRDDRWTELCRSLEVILIWSEDGTFSVPTSES